MKINAPLNDYFLFSNLEKMSVYDATDDHKPHVETRHGASLLKYNINIKLILKNGESKQG